MHRITILGAGFAALTAVQRIRAQAPTAEITLVAPHAEFLFYPSLIWIPSLRRGADLQIDLRPFLTRQRVHWHPGTVTGKASGGRQVLTDTGIIDNDGLIIASGGRLRKRSARHRACTDSLRGSGQRRGDPRPPAGSGGRHPRHRFRRQPE